MGIKSTDLYMYAALSAAIEDMRKNTHVWNDVIGDVVGDPLLSPVYGKKEIDKFRLFMSKDIQVNVEHTIDMAKLPAIAIRVGGGTEITDKTGDALGDGYEMEKVSSNSLEGVVSPKVIRLGPLTPENYDNISGKVTMPDNISLANIYDSMFVFDEVNKKQYAINLVQDDKILYIDQKANANLNGMTIRVEQTQYANIRRTYFSNEDVTFICMATEAVEVLYLYSLMLYMIGRYRISLFDSKNFKAATINYSPLYKIMEEPNNVFARDITMRGHVEHSYIEHTGILTQGISTRIDIDTMPESPADLQDDANNQGWGSPEDP